MPTAGTTNAPARPRQQCIHPGCGATFGIEQTLTCCPTCGNLLDVVYDSWTLPGEGWGWIEQRNGVFRRRPDDRAAHLDASGVWRFRELLPFYRTLEDVASIAEGRTILQRADALGRAIGLEVEGAGAGLYLQYEGMNPSGSFKDNGMTAAFTHARMVGARVVACASTGNTSASMALYASLTASAMQAVIFIGDGKIAFGKLSQALDYGARTLQIAGDFDACLARIRHIAENVPEAGVYLMNSVNPFRLEGQKSVMFRVLEGLGWEVPDWIVVPGGNLGNCSAFGKAFMELRRHGLISRVPRLAVINAHGARTLDRVYNEARVRWNGGAYFTDGGAARVDAEYARMDSAGERARTIASAIEINRPVNLAKALRALEVMDGGTGDGRGPGGVVRSVDDDTIREYKALVGRHGLGCEPASAASVAGAHALLREGVISPRERVVCILTGHVLKDPDVTVGYHTAGGRYANAPIKVGDDLDAILKAMRPEG
ncbi:MAG: threonine synthase [Phycisphaerales bacterium]